MTLCNACILPHSKTHPPAKPPLSLCGPEHPLPRLCLPRGPNQNGSLAPKCSRTSLSVKICIWQLVREPRNNSGLNKINVYFFSLLSRHSGDKQSRAGEAALQVPVLGPHNGPSMLTDKGHLLGLLACVSPTFQAARKAQTGRCQTAF